MTYVRKSQRTHFHGQSEKPDEKWIKIRGNLDIEKCDSCKGHLVDLKNWLDKGYVEFYIEVIQSGTGEIHINALEPKGKVAS